MPDQALPSSRGQRVARAVCAVDGKPLTGVRFELGDGARCLLHAVLHRPTVTRSATIAAVVGTMLFAINQLDVVVRGDATPTVAVKIALTFCVPFCVAMVAALAAARRSP